MKKCMTKTLGRGLSPDDRDTLLAKRDNRDTLQAKAAGSTHARTMKKCMTKTLGRGLSPDNRDTGPLE